MKIAPIRYAIGAFVFIAVAIGIVVNAGGGTLSGFGIADIVALCPLGSLEIMLASKTFVPIAAVSLVVAVVLVFIFGKAFCSWICPASFARELKDSLGRKKFLRAKETSDRGVEASEPAGECELRTSCDACRSDGKRFPLDSRHVVLLAALASATVFGFPVFCLVCPIGLVFGTVVLLYQFFAGIGQVSLSLVAFPVVLVIELVVMRSWCSRFCPLGALLSLLSLSNKTLRPKVKSSACLRESGAACNRCAQMCPEGLDPHTEAGMNECSKCGKCKDICPAAAITFSRLFKSIQDDDVSSVEQRRKP